jgi:hypothetical protein
MHQVLTRRARLALVGLAAVVASEAGAQQRGETLIAATNEVIGFRVNWMGDATPFNACSIYQAAKRPADFPEGISPPLRRALDRTEQPCDNRSPGVPGAWIPAVTADSVIISGDTAAVFVTVRKGEIAYHEEYTLVSGRTGRWSTREVRVWGAMREYPLRPPPSAGGGR